MLSKVRNTFKKDTQKRRGAAEVKGGEGGPSTRTSPLQRGGEKKNNIATAR